jgi:Na+/H+-dicarboxylate symporter
VAGIVNTVNGVNAYVNVDAGTIDQYVIGSNVTLDIESAVNVTGDAAIACIVAKTENQLDENIFNSKA